MTEIDKAVKTVAAALVVSISAVAAACSGPAGDSAKTSSAETAPSSGYFATTTCVAPTSYRMAALTCAPTLYGGRGVAAKATLPGPIVLTLGDSGELPSSGEARDTTVLEAHLDSLLNASAVSSSVAVADGETRARSEIAGVVLDVAGKHITADVLDSHAEAHCSGGNPAFSSGSKIANLKIDGTTVDVSSEPNQVIKIDSLLSITLNEVIKDSRGLTVSAIHVKVLSGPLAIDVALASSRANVKCGCTQKPDEDAGPPPPPPPPPEEDASVPEEDGGGGSSSGGSSSGGSSSGGPGADCDDSHPCGEGLECAGSSEGIR